MAIKIDVFADLKSSTAPEDFYYPINVFQMRDLVGKVLTHVEAMGLPERAEKANKDLVKQSLWSWWTEVQDNSKTSYKRCIGPIKINRAFPERTEQSYEWLTDDGRPNRKVDFTVDSE